MDAKTAERYAARRLIIGFQGTDVSADLRRMVERVGVAGVILFARNIESADQVARLNDELIGRTLKDPILISVDQEGGPVRRLREGFTEFPAMGVLGQIDDVELTRRVADVTAAELRAVGFNLDYAPVVDVNTNPKNPVIGARAFGSEPEVVTRHAIAFIEGLQEGGVMACAKHFPGHGDTRTDSHLGLPSVEHDRERIERVELAPFYQAAAANVAAIMTAHVLFPAYDEDNPATMSPTLLGEVLRQQISFFRVCITDDMEMKAITKRWTVPDASVRAVRAGADLLLVCHSLERQMETIETLARGLRDGELDERDFRTSVQRVDDLRQRYLDRRHYVELDLDETARVLRCETHLAVADEVKQRASESLVADASGGGARTSGDS